MSKILYTGVIHYSRLDRNGNTYWAMEVTRTSDGATARGLIDGEGNGINALRVLAGNGDVVEGSGHYAYTVVAHGKREFQGIVRGWPYLGCRSDDVAGDILGQMGAE